MTLEEKTSAFMRRWSAQCEEWSAIARELAAARPGDAVTAYQVSLEQRKRMLARGERPISAEEIAELDREHAARRAS